MITRKDIKKDTEPKGIRQLMDIHVRSSTTRPQGVGYFLHSLVYLLQPQIVLECGTCRGYSAICMAFALPKNGKIWTIDILNHRQQIGIDETERLGLTDKIEFIYSQSINTPWSLPIDLLFLDSDHTYQNVRNEFFKFSPFVTPKGIIVFHDSSIEHGCGVRKVIEDEVRDQWDWIQFEEHPGLTLCQRKKDRLNINFNLDNKKWIYTEREDKQ